MREITSWRKQLEKSFEKHLPNRSELRPAELCEIELGLYLLLQIAPYESPFSLWPLLTGHPFFQSAKVGERQMIFNARHLLHRYRTRSSWESALNRYANSDAMIRGFDVDMARKSFRQREIGLCRERWQVYETAINQPLNYHQRSVKWAAADNYEIKGRGRSLFVTIPEDIPIEAPRHQHQLPQARQRKPIEVNLDELVKTARWMDEMEKEGGLTPQNWKVRLSRGVRLATFTAADKLAETHKLRLDGLNHLVGMVGSGKSSLMDVLTVWVVRQGLRVTLVVGDVISALNRASHFTQLGLKAAPVLGSNRQSHINRLHRVLSARQHNQLHNHPGFRWLSTACPLDALRNDGAKPLEINGRPCTQLLTIPKDESERASLRVCAFYASCPYHQAQLDLPDADIWVATPQSLVFTRAAAPINSENIRFAELVARRSDLVIVDEADRVQTQLDDIFSPHQTLCGSGDGWLDNLESHVGSRTAQQGRASVAALEPWRRAFHQAQIAADAVYRLLVGESLLRHLLKDLDCFSDVSLFHDLAESLATTLDPLTSEQRYKEFAQEFDDFIDDGLTNLFAGSAVIAADSLMGFAERLLRTEGATTVRESLHQWIAARADKTASPNGIGQLALRLELAILTAVLANRLYALLLRWREVEEPLQLEQSASVLSFQAPVDYQPLIAVTPVGNLLAFQFVEDADEGAKLNFFRCHGVGRWLLLHLHELLSDEGVAGPNVLLMSGTSWAGGSPSYHVQAPVTGILLAPDNETRMIAQSEFRFLPLRDERDNAIFVSGLRGEKRAAALRQMLSRLALPDGFHTRSLLERELDELPESRRRILLVVGSYKEAEIAREHLLELRSDWKKSNAVRRLIPDDEALAGSSSTRITTTDLPRGLVDQFADTGAWLLIAPLMAVERGHNILTEIEEASDNGDRNRVAAIGSVYFLVRPHPQPHDFSLAIHALNGWAVDAATSLPDRIKSGMSIDQAGTLWRKEANKQWRTLLRESSRYSEMEGDRRNKVTWHLMVSMWQVVGRLVRGGVSARVHFCDAKFDPARADLKGTAVSLLYEMKRVLEPYFDGHERDIALRDRELVSNLYQPLYEALINIRYL
ncbi:MAG: hypothetical protein L0226_04350 [Acidobacteria bacterium]|nr:hypothetical protein [Acidobacteriota bacterium]